MRAIAFFALVALTATAFNLTDYHLGVDTLLNFNDTQIQNGLTCLSALSSDVQNIYNLIESLSFDNISLGLGDLVLQFQTDLQTTCKPYFVDYYLYLAENINITNIDEIIKSSVKQNYPAIIQTVAQWAEAIQQGQDFEAGIYQSQILQFLVNIQQYSPGPAPQVTPVPFNRTAFFAEYNAALFQLLGIDAQVNVTGLVECSYYVQNATLAFLYIKNNFTALDFEQKLDGVQYIIDLVLDSVRNCGAAAEVEELVFGPVVEAFNEDPVNFTLNAVEKFALSFSNLQGSLELEIAEIKSGQYTQAGQEKASRLLTIFEGLVNFSN